MTKKEEASAKRQAKLEAEKQRIDGMKEYERRHNDCAYICGIDEAGRGPFAGPVVAGAVILDWRDPDKDILYLNDSKKLSEKKREAIYREIIQKAVAVGIGIAGPKTIDTINILQATYVAMNRAIANLKNVSFLYDDEMDIHELVKRFSLFSTGQKENNPNENDSSENAPNEIVPNENAPNENDSNENAPNKTEAAGSNNELKKSPVIVPDFILADAVHIPGTDIPQEGIIKGDAKSVSIAAGSIIAKVTRDHIMYEYDRLYPEYGFASHKGYGTKAHIEAIKEHGMTEIHRRSFIHFADD